ncbi:MAG: hypothetical protein LBH32_11510 [Dysgonamonadaceae bacterium]|jgi:hypothetical protein|nr:hypothetical protein [Dysgonamonadaceae bacterium]
MNLEKKEIIRQLEELEITLQNALIQQKRLKDFLLSLSEEDKMQRVSFPVESSEKEDKTLELDALPDDKITKTFYADLKKFMSLNDRFRFQKQLFDGKSDLMDSVIDQLNSFNSLQECLDYLHRQFTWNWDDEPVNELKGMLEKRFG